MDVPTFDKVPDYNLYIGGFISLRRPKALVNCRITHIVSVIDWKFNDDSPVIQGFQHLHIPVDDVEDENLITWFPRSNAFIQEGLDADVSSRDPSVDSNGGVDPHDHGNGVLVHCAMGKSRSATIILAYLLWSSRHRPAQNSDINHPTQPLSVVEALLLLRRGRAIAEPNEGFMDQLHLYERMGCPGDVDANPRYQRWLSRKRIQESLAIQQAPEVDAVRFEDEHDELDEVAGSSDLLEIKCRKCRCSLLSSSHPSTALAEHEPPPNALCAHVFLHPLSWMKSALTSGELSGRLTCPNAKCGANVGKFAWQGLRCSCGGWVVPAFAVAKGRVDEIGRGSGDRKKEGDGRVGGGNAVRLPPGVGGGGVKRPGSGNL